MRRPNVNIEVERVRQQLNKGELSKKLGITSRTYANYVRGESPIPSDVLIKMALLFHCTTDYLLGLDAGQDSA